MKQGKWLPISESVVRKTADVTGPHSAAAQALADAKSRRAAGEAVEFFRSGSAIIVRGTPSAQAATDDAILAAGFDTETEQRWPNALTPAP